MAVAQAGVAAYAAGTLTIGGLGIVSQSIDPNLGLGTLFTQLGVFAVVVVVFKFMLNRQDTRDAKEDEKDAETVKLLREELVAERLAHEETRQKLYDALANLSERTDTS